MKLFLTIILCLPVAACAQGGLRNPVIVCLLKPMAAAASFPSGATHYWAFENNLVDGPGTCDLVDGGGLSYTTGKNGQCLQLDDAETASSDSCAMPATTAFSIVFWFKLDGGSGSSLNWSLGVAGLVMGGGGEGGITAKVGATADTLTSAAVTYDAWHLAVVTYDGASAQKLSVDGATFITGTVTVEGIGGDATWSAVNGPVFYDESAPFTRALTQTEVSDIWNGGTGRFGP